MEAANMRFELSPEIDLIKPYLDSAFKDVFASATEEANIALCAFISAAIGEEVVSVNIQPNEPPVTFIQEKQIRYDISCKFNNGELANVEIQVQPVIGLPRRLAYYTSKLLVSQESKGQEYIELHRAYQISILMGNGIFNDGHAIHCFELYDKEHNIELNGGIKIITGEVSKLKTTSAEALSKFEKWLVWFRDVANPKKRDMINKLIAEEVGIEMGTKTLLAFSQDEAKRLKAMQEEKILKDYNNDMCASKREGIEKGKADLIRSLLKIGADINQIAQATGLSVEQIEALVST
jgi:predicted transposase/invertase (TIGR01784 family)